LTKTPHLWYKNYEVGDNKMDGPTLEKIERRLGIDDTIGYSTGRQLCVEIRRLVAVLSSVAAMTSDIGNPREQGAHRIALDAISGYKNRG
jgi:hypothetical protein